MTEQKFGTKFLSRFWLRAACCAKKTPRQHPTKQPRYACLRTSYKLGLITPIRNTPKHYFKECISSVLHLSKKIHFPIQWTIVADGDNRPIDKWLKENLNNRDFVYQLIRSNSHIGIGAARNLAVRATSSEYLTWLDADDIINPDEAFSFYTNGINLLKNYKEISLVYSDNIETDQFLNTRHIRRKSYFHKLHLKHRNQKLDPIYYVDFVYQAQILRKSDFVEVGGFVEGEIGEDVELLLRIATHYPEKHLYHLPYSAYVYRDNLSGIVNTKYHELRNLNCKSYLTYANKANIHQSKSVSFDVMYFDVKKMVLNNNNNNSVFYNVFLPDESNGFYYIQRH